MPRKDIVDRIEKYVRPFRITKGKNFRLKDFAPDDTCGLKLDKGEATELLQRGTLWLAEEQEMLAISSRSLTSYRHAWLVLRRAHHPACRRLT